MLVSEATRERLKMLAAASLRWYMARRTFSPAKWRLLAFVERHDQSFRPKRQDLIVRTRYGFRMRIDPSDFIQRTVFYTGAWEDHLAPLVRAFLTTGGLFIDAGANVGYFSLMAADILGDRGRVIAFEASLDTAAKLRANVELNRFRNVECRVACLSDQASTASFFLGPSLNRGASSLRPVPEERETVEVATQRLDQALTPEEWREVALVKIDVEGAELLVLRGMTGLFESAHAPAVICEVSDWGIRHFAGTLTNLMEMMTAYGYRIYKIGDRSLEPITSVEGQFDVLMFKESSATSQGTRAFLERLAGRRSPR
jgi:FkbM family methyltransferase